MFTEEQRAEHLRLQRLLAAAEARSLEERRRDALARARQAAEYLYKSCGAADVYLIGSLANGTFTRWSDIDLVVKGLPDDSLFFRLSAAVADLTAPFPVDVIPWESALPAVRERVLEEGVRL